MKTSLSHHNIFLYIKGLLNLNFPDGKNIDDGDLQKMVSMGLDRLQYSFSKVKDKYYSENDNPLFNHLNSDHMVVLLYYIANSGFKLNFDKTTLEKLYYLNKIMHSVDIFYSVNLPDIFCVAHPLNTILGHAKYSDYFYVYQNVTVGSTNEGIYPTIGRGVALYSNTSIIGNCKIGDNVVMAANSTVINKNIPNDSMVTGYYPNNKIIDNKKHVINRLFNVGNKYE